MSGDDLEFDRLTEVLHKRVEEEKGDRRKKSDWTNKLATVLTLVSWVIVIAVWVVLDMASPERGMRFTQTFFEATFGTDANSVLRTRWNYTLVYAAYVLFLISIGTCAIAFVLNRFRMRRKTDKLKISILVIGGINIVAFVFFLIRFGYVIF